MASTTQERVRKYRASQKRKGMKLLQIWVPDTKAPGFAKEMARQSKLIAASDRKYEKELIDWLEQIADETGGWTA